jgi:hypothetical protein
MMLFGILGLILLLPFGASAQRPKRNAPLSKAKMPVPNVRYTSGNRAAEIPFELDGNNILLRVRVNNSNPLRFILDTAASVTVINPARAAELRLKTEGQVRGRGTGGAFQASLIKGVSLTVLGVTVSNQLIAAVPFGAFPCFQIDGILGYDFINEFAVEIDYQNKFLNLYDPRTFTYSGKGAAIPISLAGRTPVARAKIIVEGREAVEGNFEVDTGGDGALIVYSQFAKKQKLLEAMPRTIQSGGVGVGGEEEVLIGRVKRVEFGRLVIDSPTIGLARKSEEERYDGILGNEILRRSKVIFDYSRKQMILEPNGSFGDPYEVDMSGISLGADEDDCKVLKIEWVTENSPASEAGLQPGDIITAIDGKSTDSFASTDLEQLFKQNGRELTLTLKRGEELIQKKIKLRRLI